MKTVKHSLCLVVFFVRIAACVGLVAPVVAPKGAWAKGTPGAPPSAVPEHPSKRKMKNPSPKAKRRVQEHRKRSVVQEDRGEYYLALAIYHEARGESEEGMRAVGHVVLNRVAHPKYPKTVSRVVTQRRGKGCEFGWWCDGRPDTPREAKMWRVAQRISKQLLAADRGPDPTKGALWFFESWRKRPKWMVTGGIEQTTSIGKHTFYGRT